MYPGRFTPNSMHFLFQTKPFSELLNNNNNNNNNSLYFQRVTHLSVFNMLTTQKMRERQGVPTYAVQ